MIIDSQSIYYAGQGLGLLAFLVGLTAFLQPTDKRLKQRLAIYTLMIGSHFFLLGAAPAGISASLNAVRTWVSIYYRRRALMFFFIILTLALTLPNMTHAMELLPIIATLMSTVAFFTTSGLRMRCVMWFSTVGWVIYNCWLGTLGGMLIESSFLIVNGMTIYRLRKNALA